MRVDGNVILFALGWIVCTLAVATWRVRGVDPIRHCLCERGGEYAKQEQREGAASRLEDGETGALARLVDESQTFYGDAFDKHALVNWFTNKQSVVEKAGQDEAVGGGDGDDIADVRGAVFKDDAGALAE